MKNYYLGYSNKNNLPSTIRSALVGSSSPSCAVNSAISSISASFMINEWVVPSTTISYFVTSKVSN